METQEIIKKLKKKYTKWEISKLMKVSWQTIHMWERGVFKPKKEKSEKLAKLLILFLLFSINSLDIVYSAPKVYINLAKISRIESSNNPKAYNKRSKATGLYQITPICLKEYNNFHKEKQYSMKDLYDKDINEAIAGWYLNVRISQMLRYYDKPDTIENRLIAYNAGISYVVKEKGLPEETKRYIEKYKEAL